MANRNNRTAEEVVTSLVNTLPYRAKMQSSWSVDDLIASVRDAVLDMQDHQNVPLEDILRYVHRPGRGTNEPFRVMFDYQEFSFPECEGIEIEAVPWESHRGAAQFDLSVLVSNVAETWSVGFEYRPALFEEETIRQLADHYVRLLRQLGTVGFNRGPCTIGELPLLNQQEAKELRDAWNGVETVLSEGETILDRFRANASEYDESVAFASGDKALTYAEVDRDSDRVAAFLQSQGIKNGHSVAVCLDRSVEIPVILLGILKAGACYIPLDPDYPQERLQMILEDAEPSALVTHSAFSELFQGTRIFLVDDDELRASLVRQRLPERTNPCSDDLAYIIFTSGSTGRPKGVEVTHRGLLNFLLSMAQCPGMNSGDVLLAVTTVSFDISGLELFLPLVVGGRAHIARRGETVDGHQLIALIEKWDVTHLQATPATWQLLLTCGWHGKRSGRPVKMLCGGEEMPRELASKLLDCGGELWNLYGPTRPPYGRQCIG